MTAADIAWAAATSPAVWIYALSAGAWVAGIVITFRDRRRFRALQRDRDDPRRTDVFATPTPSRHRADEGGAR